MEEQPIFFVFLGMPSCGKETSRKLLIALIEKEKGEKTFFSDTGAIFRHTFSTTSYNCIQINEMHRVLLEERQQSGYLQHPLLAMHMVVGNFLNFYTNEKYVILDGSPRTDMELAVLMPYFEEMYRPKKIIYINVVLSEENAIQRMQERFANQPDRTDSSLEAIKKRIEEYQTKTDPIIRRIHDLNGERVITIDNNGTLEELAQQINAIEL